MSDFNVLPFLDSFTSCQPLSSPTTLEHLKLCLEYLDDGNHDALLADT